MNALRYHPLPLPCRLPRASDLYLMDATVTGTAPRALPPGMRTLVGVDRQIHTHTLAT